MSIEILPDNVAARIAAGEVIERPASVVKELIENSLDANASRIEIDIENGGTKLIRVTDNGIGISQRELHLAFERHGTSKIVHESDLASINTFGFRGEALPSIAAVSRVVCTSRTRDVKSGSYIEIKNSKIQGQGEQGAPSGTSVAVHDLFSDFPARLKFLKTPRAEMTAIHRTVTNLALSAPNVSFRLLNNDQPLFHSAGNGDINDVLIEYLGINVAQSLVEITPPNPKDLINVTGLISPPEINRSRRDKQAFFINGRWIQSRLLSYALDEFYREILPKRKYPIAVLNIEIPLDEIDVNVHPTKAEVRFQHDGIIFSALKRALTRAIDTPVTTFPSPSIRAINPQDQPLIEFSNKIIQEAFPTSGMVRADKIQENAILETGTIMRTIGQIHTTYIVAEGPNGLYLIDQHAAHERIRFDEILNKSQNHATTIQGLLDPLSLDLNSSQFLALSEIKEEMTSFGFQWDIFGAQTILLRAVPTNLRDDEFSKTFLEILDGFGDKKLLTEREQIIAASVACHSTIRAGQVLTIQEMDALLRQLSEAGFPRLCPHGRPTTMSITTTQINKAFER